MLGFLSICFCTNILTSVYQEVCLIRVYPHKSTSTLFSDQCMCITNVSTPTAIIQCFAMSRFPLLTNENISHKNCRYSYDCFNIKSELIDFSVN
jgi:hypothetical protein